MICVRCDEHFTIGSDLTCPRAPDRGFHEDLDGLNLRHEFVPGRLDGDCAMRDFDRPGLSCGHHRRGEIHQERGRNWTESDNFIGANQ